MRDPFSLTMDALVSTQVQVVPSVARTVTSLPATESTVPRSNASVRAPFLVSKVNSPWIPPSSRSRTSARPSRCTAAALVAGVLAVGVASASTPFSTAAWPVGPLDSAVDAAGVRFGLDPETASVTANAPPATTAQATMTAASRPRPRPPCGGCPGCRGCLTLRWKAAVRRQVWLCRLFGRRFAEPATCVHVRHGNEYCHRR